MLQIFSEIDERLRFQEDMAGLRGAAETCKTINLEIMQRVQELQKLGVDVSAARSSAATSLNSQHLFGEAVRLVAKVSDLHDNVTTVFLWFLPCMETV